MTLDELLREAGDHVDRLIDARRPEAARPSHARRWMAAAAALVVLAGVAALLVHRAGSTPAARGATPTTAAPTLFDDGTDLVVFLRSGASPDQVQLIGDALQETAGVAVIEYLDPAASLAEARRVLANDPAALQVFTQENIGSMFKVSAPSLSGDELQQLADAFKALPNVTDVRTAADPAVVPSPAPPGPPGTQTTLASLPLDTQAAVCTELRDLAFDGLSTPGRLPNLEARLQALLASEALMPEQRTAVQQLLDLAQLPSGQYPDATAANDATFGFIDMVTSTCS